MPNVSPWSSARQMIVVTPHAWDSTQATMRRFERAGIASEWREVDRAVPVILGRTGSAWGIGLHPPAGDGPTKREGDGRAPAGVFAIGIAFGYPERVDTRLAYKPMTAGDYCIDVPDSPLYNRIVDAKTVGEAAVAGSTEPMRRDIHAEGDQRYKLGFVIDHNPRAEKNAGSCIFAHLWKTPDTPTAGCTAMTEADMRATLAWLDPAKKPVFVLLPQAEHARLQARWNLPRI